jgi:hypothetical protein
MPAFFKDVTGFKSEAGMIEGTSNTFLFAEQYAAAGGQAPSGTRLFVGGLSLDSSTNAPEAGDEVLVVFEHGERGGTHADVSWAPDWIL